MSKSDNSSGNSDKLREKGAKALHESLQKNHPHTTLEDCYQIYDKMQQKKDQESDSFQGGNSNQS
jgi:hypothetical protein